MEQIKRSKKKRLFDQFSTNVARLAGKPGAFLIAFFLVTAWGVSGPIFGFSETWQLLINTTTTVITFLMVFIIQQSQNRDTMALQLKLNELIACERNASNRLIDVEDLSSDELEVLKKFYIRLSRLSEQENDLHSSHSIDEAAVVHNKKLRSTTVRK
jgi:low affinity Fe/Cu permease